MSKPSSKKTAIVIGSGFGGLAAAIRLQSAGVQTTILEKRDRAGGRAYIYKDAGFTFDAGPTVITAPQALEELFALSDRKMSDYVELLPVSPFYRLAWEDGYRFDYGQDLDATLEQIRRKSPVDVEGYRKFLNYSREVFDEGYALVDVPFLNWWDMIKVSPQLIRLQAYRSVYSQVSRFIQDEKLRQAFSFHSLLVGGNPFTASSIYTLIHYLERNWGVTFPRGGTGALVDGLTRLFTELGGKIELSAEVGEIERSSQGNAQAVSAVRTRDGRRFECDAVVSNADVVHTYRHLLEGSPDAATRAKKLEGMRHSMSLFLIYFGTNRTYPEMAHHTVIFGPRYRELLEDIFTHGKLADDFSLYLHAPTRTDPGLAPPGCEGFYVLSPVPNLDKGPIDWKKEGPRYADRILTYLEKHHLPDLKRSIVTQRIFTPEDFQNQYNAHAGAAFSLEPVLTQSAYFRVPNRDPNLKGLYFVGAGTHPGAGVPGVINSAKATTRLLLEDLRKEA
jgi:phytoene desaturase